MVGYDEQALSTAELAVSMADLSRLGIGWPGTAGEVARREYIVSRLETFGYTCTREPFAFLAYSPDASSACRSDILGDLPTAPVQYTASGAAEGRLVFVGQGRSEDLDALQRAGVELRDRVCLARTFAPSTITAELARRGAIGLIVQADTPDELIPHFIGRGFPPPLQPPWSGAIAAIPAVTVSRNDGDRLLALHGSGLGSVAIEHQATYLDATTENVVAELQGRTDEFVVVVAHYDTQRAGGAWDNNSGVAVLLELARRFRGRQPRAGVRFVSVSGEEAVMWGSYAYAQRHKDELRRSCLAAVNWDSPSSAYPAKRSCWLSASLRDPCQRAAEAANWPVEVWEDAASQTFADDAPFNQIGVPTAWFWENPPLHPYAHSAGDCVERISIEKLGHVAEVGAQLIAELTEMPGS